MLGKLRSGRTRPESIVQSSDSALPLGGKGWGGVRLVIRLYTGWVGSAESLISVGPGGEGGEGERLSSLVPRNLYTFRRRVSSPARRFAPSCGRRTFLVTGVRNIWGGEGAITLGEADSGAIFEIPSHFLVFFVWCDI